MQTVYLDLGLVKQNLDDIAFKVNRLYDQFMFNRSILFPEYSSYYLVSTEVFKQSNAILGQWFVNQKLLFSDFLTITAQSFDDLIQIFMLAEFENDFKLQTNLASQMFKHNQYLNYFIETYYTGIINYKQLGDLCITDLDCEDPNAKCEMAKCFNCPNNTIISDICKCRPNFIESLNGLNFKPNCGTQILNCFFIIYPCFLLEM
jgi:hypothetical protein